jgi:deazaflavin-dependent oxidoreductase (nitroreductase family)
VIGAGGRHRYAAGVVDDDFCYLTTTGRRSGRPHEIEIWYAPSAHGRTLYLLAGGGASSDWVRNLTADPRCTVRIGSREAPARPARGRVLADTDDEDAPARTLVFDKYEPRYEGGLSDWRARALPVALDLGDLID